MRSSMRVVALILGGVALAMIPACGKSGPEKPKIAVVTNCTAEFWSICEAGAQKAAKEHDVDLLFRQPTKMDAAEQMPIIEAWVKQGVNGLAVSVIDPKGQTPDLTRIAGKVPLVTMDNDADQTGRLCYIGIDNKEAGKAVGRLVKKALPNGGTIAMFIGSTTSANGRARTQGVLDELAGQNEATGTPANHPTRDSIKGKMYGKYFLVDGEAKTDGGPGEKPVANARDVLGRLEGINDICMIGLYAYNPPAILEAVKAKSLTGKVKIIGFDEDWETLKAIGAGEIEATVVQDPFMYGYKSVEVLAAVARGDKSKVTKDAIPYRVVTKNGGPDETINGLLVKSPKVADFEAKLREDLSSVKK